MEKRNIPEFGIPAWALERPEERCPTLEDSKHSNKVLKSILKSFSPNLKPNAHFMP